MLFVTPSFEILIETLCILPSSGISGLSNYANYILRRLSKGVSRRLSVFARSTMPF
jgi:hypothetical protein